MIFASWDYGAASREANSPSRLPVHYLPQPINVSLDTGAGREQLWRRLLRSLDISIVEVLYTGAEDLWFWERLHHYLLRIRRVLRHRLLPRRRPPPYSRVHRLHKGELAQAAASPSSRSPEAHSRQTRPNSLDDQASHIGGRRDLSHALKLRSIYRAACAASGIQCRPAARLAKTDREGTGTRFGSGWISLPSQTNLRPTATDMGLQLGS